MICVYFRSSSWNTFNSCQQQYYLQYVLGLENGAGLPAAKGNVVHKALECLAAYKLSLQNSTNEFLDDGLGIIRLDECDPDNLIKLSYDLYKKQEPHHDWNDVKDFRDCKNWMHKALKFQGGLFDPRNRNIITPEQKFDFEIREPWAKYHYEVAGKTLEGYLSLKGTIDLMTEVQPNVIEMIDWKTGATRKDFSTGKNKDFYSLHDDPQLRLYHYAAHRLYPDIKDILITIYFVRAGGPFSLMLSKEDLPTTERMIEKHFNWVKNTIRPNLNPGPPWSRYPHPDIASYKCFKLCKFSNPSTYDPSISTCEYMKNEIVKIGIDKVTEKYADMKKIDSYGSGGGRQSP